MTQKVYIVGAHSRAQTLAIYLKYLYENISIEAYLVNNDEKNEEYIDGVPVIKFDNGTKLNSDHPVYIATRGVYHEELSSKLQNLGMKDIRPVTVELDMQLRNQYLRQYFSSVGRKFEKIENIELSNSETQNEDSETQNACIYVAKSIYDKMLMDNYVLNRYEKEIQVGAALTNERLYDGVLVDNTGENISKKNKQYCELTALYWIWKNATEEIVGLCHYRRHFILPKNWIMRMKAESVDVILPVPLYVAPSLKGNYEGRHDASDLHFMLNYFRENRSQEYNDLKMFMDKNLYSPCNMFIMKKEVLEELCEWLFPILDKVVEHGGEKKDSYLNRYPGFLSERLISFFFEYHRDRYKVIYADKNFLK